MADKIIISEDNIDSSEIPRGSLQENTNDIKVTTENPLSSASTNNLEQQFEDFRLYVTTAIQSSRLSTESQLKEVTEKYEKKIEAHQDKLESKIEDSKLKIIETLGIFVALFTFISVETQILRSEVSLLAATGFSLIILGGLFLFLIILLSQGLRTLLLQQLWT